MSETKSTFSERLKQGMNEKEIKQRDLARMTGISEGTISNYRSGRFKAAQVNLQKLAQALNVSIPWLMGYDVPIGTYDAPQPIGRLDTLTDKLSLLTDTQLEVVEKLVDTFLS